MFKTISLTLLLVLCFKGETVSSVTTLDSELLSRLYNPLLRSKSDGLAEWTPHVMEFIELIDVDKVLAVGLGYLSDPEVMNFAAFIFSPQFFELIWEFESIEEFKEAIVYLASQGYEVEALINYINSVLDLPAFERPKFEFKSNKGGVSGLIDDMIAVLPLEEMKDLFESKLETSPEIGELFETINSKEFMDIMKRMSQNSRFLKFKEIFESYGFDFQHICTLAKDIFGVYYQGIFCD